MCAVWINNSNRSAYGTAVRTNNDVEGWHHRLNFRSRENMSMYLLISFLHNEASFSQDQIHLLPDGKVQKRRGKATRDRDAKLYGPWEKFKEDGICQKKLLLSVATNIGP